MKYLGKQTIFDDLMIGGVLLTPPDPTTYSYELTLPNDDGSAGQVLTTDGNGVLTWTTNGSGTVTSVGGTGTVNGITLTGTVTTSGNLTLGGTLAINNSDWSGTDLSVANGGTGVSTIGTNNLITGNGTSAVTSEATLNYDSNTLTFGDATTQATWASSGARVTRFTNDGTGAIDWGGAISIKGGDGTSGATNMGGGSVEIIGGIGTGTGGFATQAAFKDAWGSIIHKVSKQAASGTTTQDSTYHSHLYHGGITNYTHFYEPGVTSLVGSPALDYFGIEVQASGRTFLKTIDAGGSGADLDIDVDGDLHLTGNSFTVSTSNFDLTTAPPAWMVESFGAAIDIDSAAAFNVGYPVSIGVSPQPALSTGSPLVVQAGDAVGSNKAGGGMRFYTGKGTGNATTAFGNNQYFFYGSAAGSSGSSAQSHQQLFHIDGSTKEATFSGDLTVSGGDITLGGTGRIQGVDTISASTDAASKGYVDGLIPDEEAASGDTFVLKTVKVTITQAQFNSLHTTPIDLIAAPGASKQIVPVSATFPVDRLTTQANASADLNIHYDLGGSVGSYFTNSYMHIRRFMWNEGGDVTYNIASASAKIATSKTVFQNKKLQISVDSILQDSGGTQNCIGDSDIYISYYILDMS